MSLTIAGQVPGFTKHRIYKFTFLIDNIIRICKNGNKMSKCLVLNHNFRAITYCVLPKTYYTDH